MSCAVCLKTDHVQICSNCLTTKYCSREHQMQHWDVHKNWCNTQSQIKRERQHQSLNYNNNDNNLTNIESLNILQNFDCDNNKFLSNFNHCSNQQINFMLNSNVYLPLPNTEQIVTQQFYMSDSLPANTCHNSSYETNINSSCASINYQSISQRASILHNLTRYCKIILHDMNQYDFCVIDDFLQNGEQILSEFINLYQLGQFRDGQLVSKVTENTKQIRGDQIIWVDGSEKSCNNIGFLIRILDSLVAGCNASRIGAFEDLHIRKRTKAMLACYPGNYSKYVRHVDNPNRDGRCITSIYYLNKDYNRSKDGGVLRLFPQINKNIVAEIEPKFNRVIFFWSDRRNPHEVMPSSRMRFAITVWYFDDKERAIALQKYKQKNLKFPNDKDLVPF